MILSKVTKIWLNPGVQQIQTDVNKQQWTLNATLKPLWDYTIFQMILIDWGFICRRIIHSVLTISAVYVLFLILHSQYPRMSPRSTSVSFLLSPVGVAKLKKEFKHTRTLIISVNADSKLKTPDGNKSLLRGHRQGWDFKISHSFQISALSSMLCSLFFFWMFIHSAASAYLKLQKPNKC